MITKSRITLAVAILWAIIEYFTQIWPLAHISFWCWLFFGITMWSGLFWVVDTLERHRKPTNRPGIKSLTVLLSWVLILYLWIPLIAISYFVFTYVDAMVILMFLIWLIKITINAILMIRLRTYLVRRYCLVNKRNDREEVIIMTDRELLEAILEKLNASEAKITKIDEFVTAYKEMLYGWARDENVTK